MRKRLAALEKGGKAAASGLSGEALRLLSDEDLAALEEVIETGVEVGARNFEDLYAVVGERGRRAMDAWFEALEAARRGEEPARQAGTPTGTPPPPDGVEDALDLLERAQAGDEEAQRECADRNAYRIWKHYRK
jgi:hypothetical protein